MCDRIAFWSSGCAGARCSGRHLFFPHAEKQDEKATGLLEDTIVHAAGQGTGGPAADCLFTSGDAVEPHTAHPQAPHMLPLRTERKKGVKIKKTHRAYRSEAAPCCLLAVGNNGKINSRIDVISVLLLRPT